MSDYNRIAQKVVEKIAKYGRTISLVKIVSTSPNDKPWAANITNNPVTVDTKAVFVPPTAVSKFGISSLGQSNEIIDFTVMTEQVAIIAMVGIGDLRQYHKIIDGNASWGIVGSQILKPGDVPLLGYIGVRR